MMIAVLTEQPDLATAQAEFGQADQDWRDIKRRARALDHSETLDGRHLDEIDRTVARTLLESDRQTAAARLAAARTRLRAAKIAEANEKLEELTPKHAEASAQVVAARHELERAYCRMCLQAEAFRAAQGVEGRQARAILEVALDASEGEARDLIKSNSSICGVVPTLLNGEGFPAGEAERPSSDLFGASGDTVDSDAFWLGTPTLLANLETWRRHRPGQLQKTLLEVEAEQ
jgi:hypothetical protein